MGFLAHACPMKRILELVLLDVGDVGTMLRFIVSQHPAPCPRLFQDPRVPFLGPPLLINSTAKLSMILPQSSYMNQKLMQLELSP